MILALAADLLAVLDLQELLRFDRRLRNAVDAFLNIKAKIGIDLFSGQRAIKQLRHKYLSA